MIAIKSMSSSARSRPAPTQVKCAPTSSRKSRFETTQISYEDEKGRWHNEVDSGTYRPTLEG
jgi:hypothetical protein